MVSEILFTYISRLHAVLFVSISNEITVLIPFTLFVINNKRIGYRLSVCLSVRLPACLPFRCLLVYLSFYNCLRIFIKIFTLAVFFLCLHKNQYVGALEFFFKIKEKKKIYKNVYMYINEMMKAITISSFHLIAWILLFTL